jgi:hypothetical protein
MSAPSLPLILFAVADAFARGGMPEPADVRVDGNRSLTLDFAADEAGARRWAEAMGIDPDEPRYPRWRTQPYVSRAEATEGQQFTLINAYGEWQGIRVRLTALVPVEQPAAVAS